MIYPYHIDGGNAKSLMSALTNIDAMYKLCMSCGKEFQDFIEGVSYSSVAKGYFVFCSDKCCKDYLNSNIK